MALAEAKRCIHDANCCVRNLLKKPLVVPGGGASELAASIAISSASDEEQTIDQFSMRAFALAMETIPAILAENSAQRDWTPVFLTSV